MELDCKGPGSFVFYPFAAAVVDIIMTYLSDILRHGFFYHCKPVILTGDEYPSFFTVHNGLIGASVSVFQFLCTASKGKGHYLVPKTYAQNRQICF